MDSDHPKTKNKKNKDDSEPQKPPVITNTSVYVKGLPFDVSLDEMETFFRKAGLIKEDPSNGLPRIKVYRDPDTGLAKGDALVTYLKEASIDLAITLLDQRYMRPDVQISVSKAVFEAREEPDVPKEPKKKKMRNYQEAQLSWNESDERKLLPKIVVVHNFFNPTQFVDEPGYLEELTEEVRAEAEKFGSVKLVKVFDMHPEGIISIKFHDHAVARQCIRVFNGRYFDKRVLVAHFWDGMTRYDKVIDETVESARLDDFAKWIEQDSDDEGAKDVKNKNKVDVVEIEDGSGSD